MKNLNLVVPTVLFCHFLASFTALGMPLFLPVVMADLLSTDQQMYLGWYYILPTICTAITSPWWGRFADRYGKRLSLLRAQLGLALGFAIAGLAPNLAVFTIGLLLQGACGGTFAASNAYLASQVASAELAKTLNWTQFSARLSLLVAPILFGLFIGIQQPRLLYFYLAFLPLLAALAVILLPKEECISTAIKTAPIAVAKASLSFTRIIAVQFLFSFSMVVSFPYFFLYAQQLGIANGSLIGWYFSLPHLVYLIIVAMNSRWQHGVSATTLCGSGLSALFIAAISQYLAASSELLWLARVIMGVGICLTFIGVHQCFAALKATKQLGLLFGRFDSAGKWAGVLAGVLSGLVVHQGLSAPFLLSAVSAVLALFCLYLPQPVLKNKEQADVQ